MRKTLFLLGFLPIAACVAPDPIISDFNGDSVKFVGPDIAYGGDFATDYKTKMDAEAKRLCNLRGRTPESASRRVLPSYQVEYLYICL